MNPKDLLIEILRKNHNVVKIRGSDIIRINSSAILYLRYNKNAGITKIYKGKFWFGITKSEYEKYSNENLYIVCVCCVTNEEIDYITFPKDVFDEIKSKIELHAGQWKFTLFKDFEGKYFLNLSNVGKFLVDDYVNCIDFSPLSLKRALTPLPEIIAKPEVHIHTNIEDNLSLIEQIRIYSKASDKPDKFEKSLLAYFKFLGFEAERIGGPGEPDILVKNPYVFVVDAKSTKLDSKGTINFTRIKRHKIQNNARYMIIISGCFQPAVIKDAKLENACLLNVDTLEKLYNLFNESLFSPLDIEYILSKSGLITDEDLTPLRIKRDNKKQFFQNLEKIIINMDFTPKSVEEIKGRLDYYCDINKLIPVSEKDILQAIEFLNREYIKIIDMTGSKYFLRYNKEITLSIFRRITHE
ncbi:MAG: hypothetical protein NT106_15225 [Candidatus Sumerlaeota bacterium]|nr:hypothetical protein [Candidatus Sumerlaeota bacterium]